MNKEQYRVEWACLEDSPDFLWQPVVATTSPIEWEDLFSPLSFEDALRSLSAVIEEDHDWGELGNAIYRIVEVEGSETELNDEI